MYNAYVLTSSQSVMIAQQKFDYARTETEPYYETCIVCNIWHTYIYIYMMYIYICFYV